ncbi:MAG: hypothetical protein JXQ82_07765 [Methanomicrobiaceae archaeon]|nr:hypothetical protein [Methanomicrobiaceae archaeon]
MKEGYQNFDLTVRASDLILQEAFNFSEDEPEDNKPLQRRIIAVTEGVHNQTEVSAAELKEMTARAEDIKSKENRDLFPVPIVLDHSYRFLDKIGGTFALEYSDKVQTSDGKIAGIIADIEFWEDTPIQKEVAARIRRDPENTYFSIRFYGMLHYDSQNDRYFWSDMVLVHIAVVNEPADGNARIMDELCKSDFSLKSVQENNTGMGIEDLEKRLDTLEKENSNLRAWKDSKEQAELAAKQQSEKEDFVERASVLAEIMNLDNGINKGFVKNLSLEQLKEYKADLERRLPKTSTEKGAAGQMSSEQSIEDLAKKLVE